MIAATRGRHAWHVGTTALIGVIALASAVAPLKAQELDALELDDFLDPRELQSPEAKGGAYRFLASRVYVGAAERHNFRGDFFKSRVHFGRLATVYYTGRWQLTAKLTDYDTRTRIEPPYFRSRAQVARYLGGSESRAPIRAQLSWTFAQSRATGSQSELALDASTAINIPSLGRSIMGGVVYSVDARRDRHYAGASLQIPVVRWEHESSIRIGGSIAQDRDRTSRVLERAPNLYKTEVSLAVGIPGTESRVYAAYSPAYRRDLREWNHEITVLLDATVLSKLFK